MCASSSSGGRRRGAGSRAGTRHPALVQAFDLMIADRYAGDGVVSQRLVRDTYAVPDDDDDEAEVDEAGLNGAATNGSANGRATRRRESAATAKG